MGAIVEACASVAPPAGEPASSREQASRAAQAALASAGVSPDAVDLILNVGLHRDENISEPAMAPFVQRAIGANPSSSSSGRTLSFDIMNGECGALTAARVADGFLHSGRFRRALVVASDIDANPGASEGLDLDATGAALLLAPGGDKRGFFGFSTRTFGKHANLAEAHGYFSRDPEAPGYATRVCRAKEYVDRLADCAATEVERYLAERSLELDALDLVVPSVAPAGFAAGLFARLELDEGDMAVGSERTHTAAPLLALEHALEGAGSRNLLWVAAGSGITISLALYRG